MLDTEGGWVYSNNNGVFNFQEIRKNVDPRGLSVLTFLGSIEREVPLSDIQVPGAS